MGDRLEKFIGDVVVLWPPKKKDVGFDLYDVVVIQPQEKKTPTC
jgi:hypothetical protein